VRARYNQAVLLGRTGDRAGALDALGHVLALAPDHPAARVEMAQLHAGQDAFGQAVAALEEHVRCLPDDPVGWQDLAVFAERAGDWPAAERAWARLVALGQAAGPALDLARVRLLAVRAELHGADPGAADALRAAQPGLRHAVDKALAHAGRGRLRL
jgi:predicted Zn-dependent protease